MKYLNAYLREKKTVAFTGNRPDRTAKRGSREVLSALSVPSGVNVSEKKTPQTEEAARSLSPRGFLGRPLGQEENPDAWDAWTPFMVWLLEHHPDHYHAICAAEDVLAVLEREGMTDGLAYRLACDDLRQRFETARRLALRERSRVWEQ